MARRPRPLMTFLLERETAADTGPARLIDSYGRAIRDLRISVTDRCNFRCVYCMPEEGMQWLARDTILSLDEIERLARVAVSLGIDEIRLTGGEPTLRPGLTDLVRRLAGLDGPAQPEPDHEWLPARPAGRGRSPRPA